MSGYYVKDCGEYMIQSLTDDYISSFMSFFAANLNPENLLAHHVNFIKKQFYNNHLQAYNFLIAVGKADNAVVGAIGFVDTAFYDNGAKENFVWMTNWLASKDEYRTAGLNLLYGVFDYKKGSTFGTVGNNDVSGAIYKRLGFASGQLVQYFIANDARTDYALLRGYTGANMAYAGDYTLARYAGQDFNHIQPGFPYKSKTYIENKYAKNPFYAYDIFTIQNNGLPSAVLVVKTDEHNGATALRIVDFIGEPECLSHIGGALQTLLMEKDAEYIDFYCYGIADEILLNGGFIRNDMDGGLIVPCYFEPFCPVSVPIQFCCQTDRPFTIFKGDGDRDFPRMLNQL